MSLITFTLPSGDQRSNIMINQLKSHNKFKWTKVSTNHHISHLLYVDDVFIFCVGIKDNVKELAALIEKYKKAT